MLKTTWALLLVVPALASAQPATPEARERCATRLSAALLGRTASASLFSATDPQASADALIGTPEFQERFARYVNSQFNPDPGATPADDAAYALAKYVLANNLAWNQMFTGPFRVDPPAAGATSPDAVVVNDSNGLGYFHSRTWMVRYAGNELAGYRLVTAYRMLNNVLGTRLQAAVNTNGVDATGRMQAACAGCHYDAVHGLDLIAKVLGKRVGTGSTMTFAAPTEVPQTLFGGISVSTDRALVGAMVESLDFKFGVCRLATAFLYGRPEYRCEGTVFDKCVAAFSADGKIQSAIAAIAKDPSFCQ